jgi:capsular polysaccharide transport system permease protein
MIDRIKQTRMALVSTRLLGWLQQEMAPALLRRRIIGAAVIASLLATIYWLFIASDRYVSEAHVIIQRTDLAGGQSMDFSSLLGGAINGSRADQLLLRDHLLSIDMLKKLDATLNLRAHYSDSQRDPLSRMWFQDASMEWFHRHYLTRVSVEFDEYAGVLLIKSQGYDPKKAQAITSMLVREGEKFMNKMAHDLADEQVAFLEKQVEQMSRRTLQARQAVLNYQNRKGLVSPQATVTTLAGIVAKLEAQRTELEIQRRALQAYLVSDHPNIVQLDQQAAAITRQIAEEEAKLASPGGKTLNRTVEEFQRLEMEAGFAQDVYKTALIALEKGRVEAIRTLKKVSVLQAPSQPEFALEPRRYYNTLVFTLVAMLLAGVAHLLAAIVRDHKD